MPGLSKNETETDNSVLTYFRFQRSIQFMLSSIKKIENVNRKEYTFLQRETLLISINNYQCHNNSPSIG